MTPTPSMMGARGPQEIARKHADIARLMGEVSAVINEVLPAKEIVDNMVSQAVQCIRTGAADLSTGGRARL